MLSQTSQKRCFLSHDACRPWSKCLVEKSHPLKDVFSHPEVWTERAIRRPVKSFSVSIIMTTEAKTHHPISRPFRPFVVRPRDFYLATEGADLRPLLDRAEDFLEPIPIWRHVIICKDNNLFQRALS